MIGEDELKIRLTPGKHPENLATNEVLPCGRCDGVIYLGAGVEAAQGSDGKVETRAIPSLEREALRYLKPMPALWRALHRGKIGVSTPHGIESIFTDEMLQMEKETGRPIEWMFTCEEAGIFAVQPQYLRRWKVYRTETPGVWIVLLD